jgi:hypothetical protein
MGLGRVKTLLAGDNSYKHSFILITEDYMAKKIEAPRMDVRASSHVESTCKEEKTNGKYRSDTEADRDAAKSIQHRIITRLATLKLGAQTSPLWHLQIVIECTDNGGSLAPIRAPSLPQRCLSRPNVSRKHKASDRRQEATPSPAWPFLFAATCMPAVTVCAGEGLLGGRIDFPVQSNNFPVSPPIFPV